MIKLKTILEAGIKPDQSNYLKRKIKLTNQLSFYLSLYVLLFAVVFVSFQRLDLFYIAITALFFYVLPLFLNRYGMWQLARFLMSITPSIVISFIHTILIEPNEEVLYSLIFVQMAVLLLPWILYDLREKKILIVSFLLCSMMLSFVYLLNDLIDIHIESGILRGLFFEIFCTFSSITIIAVCLFVLQKSNSMAEEQNSLLILEMQDQQHKLYENEHKLSEYIREIEKSKEEDRIRQWRADGIAKFNEMIRRDMQHTQKLYDEIIAEMVKHISANQGGFFILNEHDDDEPFLEMVACYAYEKSKYIDKKIYVSEGLMGQAYQDKEPIMLTEVPPQYVHITSGLGRALPRSILIVPLKYNQNICGIIELASFNVFQPHHIEFVRRVGEIIASAILTAQSQEKTQLLLIETQQQAEQMRAQEEEMRQNVEELNATQEEMQRRQAEIEGSNQRMKSNELILKKMLEKLQDKERETSQLLQDSQQKNEELKAGEEELRQNLEELSATQEEMQRRQADIESTNQRMKSNELILKKMVEQFKEKEADYLAKIQALESGK